MINITMKDVKKAIRNKYAFPGGYELAFVTSDGALLCTTCAKENFRSIIDDMKSRYNTGWKIEAITYEAVSAECCAEELLSYCDQCNKVFGELA